MAARSKACVCGRLLSRTLGLNPSWGMDVCHLWGLCVIRERSLWRADRSSRGVLPTVACLTKCDHESSTMRRPWPTGCSCAKVKKKCEQSKFNDNFWGFRASSAVSMKSAPFWDIPKRRFVVIWRRIGTTSRYHLQGQSNFYPRRRDR